MKRVIFRKVLIISLDVVITDFVWNNLSKNSIRINDFVENMNFLMPSSFTLNGFCSMV